jgi:hypothetical protein
MRDVPLLIYKLKKIYNFSNSRRRCRGRRLVSGLAQLTKLWRKPFVYLKKLVHASAAETWTVRVRGLHHQATNRLVDYYAHIYNVKIQETDAKQHYLPSKVVIKKRKVTEPDRN